MRYLRDKDTLKLQHKEYSNTSKGRIARQQASARYRETPEGIFKQKARAVVNHGIRDKKIIKPIRCSVCLEDKPLEAHHKDYSKPTDVVWLCKQCHEDTHHLNEGNTSI